MRPFTPCACKRARCSLARPFGQGNCTRVHSRRDPSRTPRGFNAHERTLIDATANVRFVAHAKPKIARARSHTFWRFLARSCVFVRVRSCSCAFVRDRTRSCVFVHVRDTCLPNCTIYYTYSKLFYFCPIATFIRHNAFAAPFPNRYTYDRGASRKSCVPCQHNRHSPGTAVR